MPTVSWQTDRMLRLAEIDAAGAASVAQPGDSSPSCWPSSAHRNWSSRR